MKKAPVKIMKDMVIQSIENPDLIIPDPNNPSREWRIKKIQGYCLKVVVEFVQYTMIAITFIL